MNAKRIKRRVLRNAKKVGILKILLPLAVIVFILIVVSLAKTPQRRYTFEEGFNETRKIDEKYGTNFREERLNYSVVKYENIDPMLDDLKEFREDITKSFDGAPNHEEEALLLFIDIRTLMLFSQKNWYLAREIGDIGLVSDEGGYSCAESGYLISAAYYYNITYSSGIMAYSKLDDLLNYYRDIPNLWKLVGIDKEKSRFFLSPFGWIKNEINKNTLVLENICYLNISKGLSLVDPEIYKNLPKITKDQEKEKA